MELTGSVSGNINLGGSGGGGLDDVLVKKTTDYESVVENNKAYIDLSWVASKANLSDYVTLDDMNDYYNKIEVNGLLNQKQDKLIILGTASGEIASFNDGADKPMPALKVGIEPQQDLHGYDSPWAGGAGKNKLNYDAWKGTSVNNGTAVYENNGVTITATSNDAYTVYGGWSDEKKIFVNEGETVTLSWEESTNANGVIYIFPNGSTSGAVYKNNSGNKEVSYTVASGVTYITFRFGVTSSGTTIAYKNIMVRKSGNNTWQPYSNICPISGHTEANIVVSPTTDAEDGTTYNIQFKDGDNPLTVYGGSLDVVSGVLTVDRKYWLITPTIGQISSVDVSDCIVNLPQYTSGASISVNKAISDKMKVVNYSSAHDNHIHFQNYALIGVYLSEEVGATKQAWVDWFAEKQITLCYKLATPITYQLTPTQVKSLLGQNNIWADTGDVVEAVYVKDFKKVIDMLVDKSAYSTAEKQIGTWIDGKKLFRRSFILTASNLNNSPFVTDIPSNIIDNIWIDASATFIKTADNSGNYITAVGYWNPANNFDCRLQTNDQYVNLQTWHNGGMSYQDGSILTLLYTKVNE